MASRQGSIASPGFYAQAAPCTTKPQGIKPLHGFRQADGMPGRRSCTPGTKAIGPPGGEKSAPTSKTPAGAANTQRFFLERPKFQGEGGERGIDTGGLLNEINILIWNRGACSGKILYLEQDKPLYMYVWNRHTYICVPAFLF